MGQTPSCVASPERGLHRAIKNGALETVESMLKDDPRLSEQRSGKARWSALHFVAATGRIEVLSMLLETWVDLNSDALNRYKQTPLMIAAMHGKMSCLKRLIEAGANILMFDSVLGRTCLHYAALYGHSDCIEAILSAANSSTVANSWGYNRFMNVRDKNGATPLHLAARQGHTDSVHVLLDKGALVCASTGGYGYLGSTPLHLAARGGSLDCVRELLAWGADRLQRDSKGRIPYIVAIKYKHVACAALLNPSAAEPLVWPSSLKFITDLNPEAKALLECALIEANKEREKAILKKTIDPPLSSIVEADDDISDSEESNTELCCICFDQECTIEVRQCGHQMCAHCTLSLCCHNKKLSSSAAAAPYPPICPFCRSTITQLVVAKSETNAIETEQSPSRPRRSRPSITLTEGTSSSFKSLAAIGSFGKIGGRSSGKVAAECSEEVDK